MKHTQVLVELTNCRLHMHFASGVGISKGRKCCDLVNASYLWLTDRYDAFTRSQHLRPFEIPTPGLHGPRVLLTMAKTFDDLLEMLVICFA